MAKTRRVERYFKDVATRKIIPLRSDYRDGEVSEYHHHRRHQLIYGVTGMVIVETDAGTWVMPPQRGMWIPAGTRHRVRTIGQVLTHSLYFEPSTTQRMPKQCRVVCISPFVRGLIGEAVKLPDRHTFGVRDNALMRLLELEARELPHLPLSLPLPKDKRLALKCHAFLNQPTAHSTLLAWSKELGSSIRTFTRTFRRETGMSFMHWRQQACLLAAFPRLSAGDSITQVALDLGYDNPAAFTTMFKRALGLSPRAYLKQLPAAAHSSGQAGSLVRPSHSKTQSLRRQGGKRRFSRAVYRQIMLSSGSRR
ncbi:MAG: AraC family transcriptional regulator [Terriglobales bacterium]